jgi:hypothetical protein
VGPRCHEGGTGSVLPKDCSTLPELHGVMTGQVGTAFKASGGTGHPESHLKVSDRQGIQVVLRIRRK